MLFVDGRCSLCVVSCFVVCGCSCFLLIVVVLCCVLFGVVLCRSCCCVVACCGVRCGVGLFCC